MGRVEDLLLVEQAGHLPPEMQRDLDTLRRAGVVPSGERAMPGSAEAVGQTVASPAGSETATPTTTGKGESIIPAIGGAVVGGLRGAQIGGRFGWMPGRVIGGLIGAGLGAAGGETAQIGVERADRVPAASAPPQALASRVLGAAEQGVEWQAVGEGLGLAAKTLQAVGRALLPGVTAGAKAASRAGVPLGLSELAASIRRGVLGTAVQKGTESGLFGKAAEEQSGAVANALRQRLDKLGGEVDSGAFGASAQKAMRTTLRRLQAKITASARPAQTGRALQPMINSLTEFIGQTASTAKITAALVKNPAYLATVLREVGLDAPKVLPEMQRAWLTGLLEQVTGKGGIRSGLVNGEKAAALFGDLGHEGQRLLFGLKAPALRQFFDVLAQAHVSSSFGAASKTGSPLMRGLGAVLAAAGVGAGIGGYERGYYGKRELIGGIATGLLAPYLAAKLLVSPGGVEFLTGIANTAHDPGLFRQALPGLVRAGSQLIGQALGLVLQPLGTSAPQTLAPPSTPASGRTLGPFTLAAPAPQEPAARTLVPPPPREPVSPSARPLPGFP